MMRIIFTMMISICLLFLTGCWDRVEINDIALIEGIGIDKEDGRWRISAQINIPKLSEGSQGTGGRDRIENIVRYGEANTLAEAFVILQRRLPRKVFWGHTKVVIFSEKIALEGIREGVDFLARHPQPRPRAYIFISKGNAKEILEIHPALERSTTEVLRELSKQKQGIEITLLELVGLLPQPPYNSAIPIIETLSPAEKNIDNFAYTKSTALFHKDKMVSELNEKVSRGVQWIRNDIRDDLFTVEPKNAEGSLIVRLLRSHTKLKPKYVNGQWKMTVKTKAQFDVIENGSHLKISDPKEMKVVEQQLKKDLIDRMDYALKVLQKEKKIDVLGFAEEYHRRYPKQWKKAAKDWNEIFPKVEVSYDVKITILRQGKTNAPQGVPQDEVKK
ncbi:Ger(x)C family spore germination protein [Paenibacillus sp. PL91]|uniref:Ger(x)C family spore germination protein n=1 Tax=Paenibacillus sp. PL91 TaxID=2729538 RepID=UPI00145D4757|nr:Ger(x)C family spore germination protein [Paenibacillus sp. PL91]MBC9199130.1 Ger(x)C family spore germination protein [Paenibacillus sp. PL91]